ncbi:hypothetical protein SLS56_004333 [Neofusicoccum ribis]|uniref:Uncharacterized protein n=1 Tax=Neofusicoccum ribis TaxID=45134 RepID=A0ABR3SWS7_9PEZI
MLQYDVALPTIPMLLTPGKEEDERLKSAECFIHLCKLSQILGDVLPLVYDLNESRKEIWRELRRLECNLDEWEEGLPEFLQAGTLENGISVSGANSLRLGYLSIRMLLCRISLRLWTVTGHLLVSAATILLRCAIDTTDTNVVEACKTSLKSLQERLHLAKEQDNWDLADMFIKRCDEPISRITAISNPEARNQDVGDESARQDPEETRQQIVIQEPLDFGLSTYSELNIPIGPLDYPWESLWDMLEGPQGNN